MMLKYDADDADDADDAVDAIYATDAGAESDLQVDG